MHKIQILGTGCTKCTNLTNATTTAADELGIPYELEKVTDFLKFADFGVMVTPALVVDGKVLASGKVPKHDELLALLPKS
jgi:small redox-active disulfide protein 2